MAKKPKLNATPLGGADDRPRMFVSEYPLSLEETGFRADSWIGGVRYGGIGSGIGITIHNCLEAVPAGAIDGGMVIIIAEKGSIHNVQR